MPFTVETANGAIVGERARSGEPALVLHCGRGLSGHTDPLSAVA